MKHPDKVSVIITKLLIITTAGEMGDGGMGTGKNNLSVQQLTSFQVN
ncbi:MAG: hypothetical protein F6J89_11880 [Symploca sp. SIO1C4]|uniref:Uncharacterized protein n=1 Tax=Symploca sp. SIO1C4 TaxID=2607765 RepID=A0A6B3NDV0_9CYAN|nr:hypothetical protein [Symploca sp. SIO1C4]